MAITAKKLAQILGLSETAVSMALNNKEGVSAETRQLVMETAEQYGYDFSRIALKRENYTIAVIIYTANNTIFSQTEIVNDLLQGIADKCKDEHVKTKIIQFYENVEEIESLLEKLRMSRIDGMLVLGTEMNVQNCRRLKQLKIPMVVLDSFFIGINCDSVLINNREGAYLATTYLISKYLQHPGHLRSSLRVNNFSERREGFRAAVTNNGLSINNCKTHLVSPTVEGTYHDLKDMLKDGEKPTRAYFADNDLIAIGAIRAFQEAGYRIPQDIAIIGFDNTVVGTMTTPTLSTVSVNRNIMARQAVSSLLTIIKRPSPVSYKIAISTYLVIRDSA